MGGVITREQILKDIAFIMSAEDIQDDEVTLDDIWNEVKKKNPSVGLDKTRKKVIDLVSKGLLKSRNVKIDGNRRKAYRYTQEG